MTTFTRGESGKPSRLAKGLLLGSMALLIGCTEHGKAFLRDTTFNAVNTGVSTYVYNEVNEQMYGRENTRRYQEERDINLIFSGGKWTYNENGTGYRTKLEDGKFFRMTLDGSKWLPVPDGTPIFYFR